MGPFFFTQPNPTHGWTQPMSISGLTSILDRLFAKTRTVIDQAKRSFLRAKSNHTASTAAVIIIIIIIIYRYTTRVAHDTYMYIHKNIQLRNTATIIRDPDLDQAVETKTETETGKFWPPDRSRDQNLIPMYAWKCLVVSRLSGQLRYANASF